MMLLKKILVATDFSEPSDAAFAYGRELARAFNASITVVHVVDNVAVVGYGIDSPVYVDPSWQAQVEASARQRLDAIVSAEDRAMLNAQTVILTSNTTAAAIVEHAKKAAIDLLVIGTHGRGGMAHLLMGSVAERVVRTAPCPVLTVRHPEREFVLPDALVAVERA